MTRQEYEEKLADLQSRIDELRHIEIEDDIPKPPRPRWKPEIKEHYYFIDSKGYVADLGWAEDQFDLHHFNIGNMFERYDDAAFALERLKVLAQMREWAGNWNDPWYLRFFDGNIAVNERILTTMNLGELRFACKDDAENCIRVIGEDRIKKYYFRIPDNEEGEKTDDRE